MGFSEVARFFVELTFLFVKREGMRIFSRKTLSDFWKLHPDAEQPLRLWFKTVDTAAWKGPADIKALYRSADFLAEDRVVFDIKGNKYRIVARVSYRFHNIFIRFIGTHAEYDKIDAAEV